MYLDPSRIADLKELDRDLRKSVNPKERRRIVETRDNILRMAQNTELGKIREQITVALKNGDKQTAKKLNDRSLKITRGEY